MRKLFSAASNLLPFRLPVARYRSLPPSVPEEWRNKKLPHQTRHYPDLLLHKYILNREKMDTEKWDSIRAELLATTPLKITPLNMDAIIIDTCCAFDCHDAALEYCQYMKANNHKFNLATVGKYFKLLTRKNDKPLSPSEEDDILRLYDVFRKDYPIIDATTAENCAVGLARTRNWRESINLIEFIEESTNPCNEALTAVICAAFRANEPDIAWEHIKKVASRRRLLLDRMVYKTYIEYYEKTAKSTEELEAAVGRLLQALGEWDMYPYLESMGEFAKVLEKHGWGGNKAHIGMNGVCSNCGHQLPEMVMSNEDFQSLKEALFSKTLLTENIWNKTTPKELNKFNRFIQAAKPYDIVVDGLNVEYSLCTAKSSNTKHVTGGKLARLVELLVSQNKKIVVLGRKHMTNWVKTHFHYIQQNSKLFLANNLSHDDPFLLYATLHGGPDTYFISKDLMRQHKYNLKEPHIQKLFKLWQMTHQIQPAMYGGFQQNAITLHYPPVFAPTAHKDNNGWHLPCMEDNLMHQPAMYEASNPWYCFRKDLSYVALPKKASPLSRLQTKGRLKHIVKR